MKQRPNLLWITALLLGWLLDFLFWKHGVGINFAIYAVLCLAGGLLVLRLSGHRIARGALWLIVLILLFALITVVRAEPLTAFLSLVLTLFLMSVLAATFLSGHWWSFSLLDYLLRLLKLGWSMVARPLAYAAERRRQAREPSNRGLNPWPVVRGILIALPILVVFGTLLSSADVVFGNELQAFVKLLRLQNLPEYVFRLIYILAAAYALAGVFLHAATHSQDEVLVGEDSHKRFQFLGFVEAAIVLGSVIVLFAAFGTFQFRYFFGGQANIAVEGYTYSEYARRGFGELIAVAVFSLVMILVLGAVTVRTDEAQRRIFSGLCALIVALVMVMLVSAYQRLVLYEFAYGFSRLRTYAHVFLIWIGLLLVAVVVLEILHRERLFAFAALIASLGFALSLSALNVDGFIVRQNVARAVSGENLDVPYLTSLSTDSVPAMVELLDSPSLPSSVHESVGAALACRLHYRPLGPDTDWRVFTLSRWQAENALRGAQTELKAYGFQDESGRGAILAPSGAKLPCQSD